MEGQTGSRQADVTDGDWGRRMSRSPQGHGRRSGRGHRRLLLSVIPMMPCALHLHPGECDAAFLLVRVSEFELNLAKVFPCEGGKSEREKEGGREARAWTIVVSWALPCEREEPLLGRIQSSPTLRVRGMHFRGNERVWSAALCPCRRGQNSEGDRSPWGPEPEKGRQGRGRPHSWPCGSEDPGVLRSNPDGLTYLLHYLLGQIPSQD